MQVLLTNIRIADRVILSDSRASRANPFHLGQTFSLFHEKLRPRCIIGPVHHAALQTREKRAIGGARFTGFVLREHRWKRYSPKASNFEKR